MHKFYVLLGFLTVSVAGFSLYLFTAVPELMDTTLRLEATNGRLVDIRVLAPESCDPCPLIVFSHGANAAYDRYDKYLVPLALKGYRIAAANHVDSEEHPNRSQYGQSDSLPTRLEDYALIAAHFKPETLIAAGHSYGGLIAQMAGGAQLGGDLTEFGVDITFRPALVIALSPPGEVVGYTEARGWAKLSVPTLVVTGTTDVIPGFADTWQSHLASFEAAPKGLGYSLVYAEMDHYMNGAYGRETVNSSAQRVASVRHLVESSHRFIQATLTSTESLESWETLSERFVLAHRNLDVGVASKSFQTEN